MTKSNRKIGLGVMGWADMLVELGIGYDSDEAIRLAHEVMGFIHEEAIKASEELARDRGVFPNWEESTWEAKGQAGAQRHPHHHRAHRHHLHHRRRAPAASSPSSPWPSSATSWTTPSCPRRIRRWSRC